MFGLAYLTHSIFTTGDWLMVMAKCATASFRIASRSGLCMRDANRLCKVAAQFVSQVSLRRGNLQVDGKSLLGVMMLDDEQASTLRVHAEGPDASAAISALAELGLNSLGLLGPAVGSEEQQAWRSVEVLRLPQKAG